MRKKLASWIDRWTHAGYFLFPSGGDGGKIKTSSARNFTQLLKFKGGSDG